MYDDEIKFISFIVAVLAIAAFLITGSPGNLDYVKEHAEERWESVGFEIIGYEGYQWGFWGYNTYGGAKVWYNLKKSDNNIMYNGFLRRWGDEIHVYNLEALDAIRPNN